MTLSIQTPLEDGSAVEVAIVGNEGLAGWSSLLGRNHASNRVVVQVPGQCVKVPADIVKREFLKGGAFQDQLFSYTESLFEQISQTSVCSRRHSVKQRLSRWLLMVRDCIRVDEIPLTHDFISQLLGCRRASISTAAIDLQRAGAIGYTRRRIHILNSSLLAEAACECYEAKRECRDQSPPQRPYLQQYSEKRFLQNPAPNSLLP